MRYFFLSFLLIFSFSCGKYGKLCLIPPPTISFRLMDNNNKDLLVTEIIDQSSITIKDETSKSFKYRVHGNDTIKVIEVSVDGNKGNHTYKLAAGGKSVDFSMNIVHGKCGYYIEDEKIISPSSFTKTPGFYVIKFP